MAAKEWLLGGAVLMLGLAGAQAHGGGGGGGSVIGAQIGVQIMMEEMDEKACEEGRLPDAYLAADIDKRSEARLAQYFERIGGDDHGSVTHLFIDSGHIARWTGPDGATQPVRAIVDPVGAARAKGTLTRKAFTVGGDNGSARGVWELSLPDAADPSKTDTYQYGVDFKLGSFGGIWIWHMHLYRAPDSAPPPPSAFCHVSPPNAY